jgi:Patatin-like phospholipase
MRTKSERPPVSNSNDGSTHPLGFEEIFEHELRSIAIARSKADPAKTPRTREDVTKDLCALCLSGGGIRSATFSLGGLQALDRRGLLRSFDYLSTVSGGGYIGSWLTALIKRLSDQTINLELPILHTVSKWEDSFGGRALDRTKVEPAALQFLRENSSYLAPRPSFLSGDTWSLFSIYVRNLLLNWLVLIPFLAGLITIPRLFILIGSILPEPLSWSLAVLFLVASTIYPSTVPGFKDVFQELVIDPKVTIPPGVEPSSASTVFLMKLQGFLLFRLLPVYLFLFFLTSAVYREADGRSLSPFPTRLYVVVWISAAIFLIALGILFWFGWQTQPKPERKGPAPAVQKPKSKAKPSQKFNLTFFLQTLGGLSVIGWDIYLCQFLPVIDKAFFVWFPPVAIVTLMIAATLFAGISDPLVEDENREWWARSAGYFLLLTLISLVAFYISLPPDPLLKAASGVMKKVLDSNVPEPAKWAAVIFGSGAISFFTRIEGSIAAGLSWLQKATEMMRQIVFGLAMSIFIGVLGLGLSLTTQRVSDWLSKWFVWFDPSYRALFACLIVVLFCLAFSIVLSLPIDINRTSPHIAYRNRLVRTFLGASHFKRIFNPFTGFSATDNIDLREMVAKETAECFGEHHETHPQRPFHILGGSVNLASGERLAWQERRAVPFTFSVAHCGSASLGYRPSSMFGNGITLGTAMAISGAAANSGMGFYTSPLKSFFLALLNARLGWWLGNPNHKGNWKKKGPLFDHLPLMAELFSLTNRKYGWINVSDGGHFDNTGVYEMLRRRCRRILLIDADSSRTGIATATRKARIDLGVDVVLDYQAPANIPYERYSIYYDNKLEGQLIRIYPALTDKLRWSSFENREQRSSDQNFPDDPLTNQFFTETLFESYRKLGLDIMTGVLESENTSEDQSDDRLGQVFKEVKFES